MTTAAEMKKQINETTYRWLKKEEWGRIAEIFRRHEVEPPNEDISIMVVAEDGDKVVGLLPFQLVGHAEPLWIAEGYHGRVNWKQMVGIIEAGIRDTVPQYFVFAPDERIARMCEIAGMERLPWVVFRRRL
jgi:hypothetical protein